jgi:hypothetical protein
MDAPANPSADKFGPPPGQERFEPPQQRARRAWYTLPIAVLYFIFREQIRVRHGHGWAEVGFGLLAAGLGVADYVVRRSLRDQRRADGGSPYMPPPNITR